MRWEKRKPGADSRGGVALRRTGGKSTTRCTDLEMCDRRRTRNSSEAVRKSNYENVEHATQSERGKEKNRERVGEGEGGGKREKAQRESLVGGRKIKDTRFFMQSEKSRQSKSYRDIESRRISDRKRPVQPKISNISFKSINAAILNSLRGVMQILSFYDLNIYDTWPPVNERKMWRKKCGEREINPRSRLL